MTLTEEKRTIGRRNFIKAVAATPVAGALIWKATSMTPVKAGIIGIGAEGGVLLENCPPTHLRVSACCDIFPDHLKRALDIAHQNHDPNAEGFSDYRQLLERKDIEAVIIATPLHLHDQMTVDALQAGKHVFVEKSMAISAEGCRRMNEAARSARRNLQVGHQRNYNPLYQEAKSLIDSGEIGDIYHIRTVWHRNGDWRRAIPETSFDPSPYGYPDLEHWKNWRMYEAYSRGQLTELTSHQLQVVNWFAGRLPTAVYGTGGIYRYKDTREVPDHSFLMFEYPGHLTYLHSTIQSNAQDHYYENIMGTKGTIILSGEREALLFYEGGQGPTELKTQTADPSQPVMQASESRARDAAGTAVAGDGTGFNAVTAYRLELEGFARTIRDGTPNLCDGVEGMNSTIPILVGYEAIQKKSKVEIPGNQYAAEGLS